jgi:hypothetical protein
MSTPIHMRRRPSGVDGIGVLAYHTEDASHAPAERSCGSRRGGRSPAVAVSQGTVRGRRRLLPMEAIGHTSLGGACRGGGLFAGRLRAAGGSANMSNGRSCDVLSMLRPCHQRVAIIAGSHNQVFRRPRSFPIIARPLRARCERRHGRDCPRPRRLTPIDRERRRDQPREIGSAPRRSATPRRGTGRLGVVQGRSVHPRRHVT